MLLNKYLYIGVGQGAGRDLLGENAPETLNSASCYSCYCCRFYQNNL